MAWEAIYVLGDARPLGWLDSETGEYRHRSNPLPGTDLPASHAPEDVEAWLEA